MNVNDNDSEFFSLYQSSNFLLMYFLLAKREA